MLRSLSGLLAVRSLELLACSLPLRAALPIGRLIGRLIDRCVLWRSRVVRENMRTLCCGQLGVVVRENMRKLRRQAFEHLGQALLLSLQPRWRDSMLFSALQCDLVGASLIGLFPCQHALR